MPARLAPVDEDASRDPPAPATVETGGATARRFLVLLALCGLVLVAGAASVIWSLHRESVAQHQATVLEDAERHTRAITQMRNFYSAEIVPRARDGGLAITHAYRDQPGSLPLPATFMLDFGDFVGQPASGQRVRLFSELPFPWRAGGHKLDDFETAALAALRTDPDRPFHRIENVDGVPTLRYAIADRLQASCVECHNRYPGSPRTDWKVGDVRGVLEVSRPIVDGAQRMRAGLREAVAMSTLVIGAAMLLVGLAFRGLRTSIRATERLAQDREAANQQLRGEVVRRAETESILRFSEGTLRATFDGMLDGVLVYDRAFRIVQCNRVAALMFGHEPHTLPGTSALAFLPEEALQPTVTGAAGRRRRVEGVRRDGTRFPADLAISELRLGDAPYYAALVADATAQDMHERELSAARDAALDSTRAKSQFLANMSHEIRTPMNGVIGVTDLLRDTALDPEQQEMVATVQRSAHALLTIIDDILDLSKIEAGKLRLQQADFDPVESLEDTFELVADRAAAKGLQLGYRIEGMVPGAMHGDEVRFRQVLSNLVGNAVKFTSRGGVEVLVSFQPAVRQLELRVRDTGPGIPADKVRDLFQPFSQVDGSATRRFGGTGLGLAISRQLVELMGGTIGVTTREGEGSEFRFSVGWHPAVDKATPRAPRARLAGRPLALLGFDPLQRAQLAGWGVVVQDAEPDAAPTDAPVLVDGARPDAVAVAARLAAAHGGADGSAARVALVARRPLAGAGTLPRLAWPLRARAVAALLDGTPDTPPAVPATRASLGIPVPSVSPGAFGSEASDGAPAAGPPGARATPTSTPKFTALVVEDNAINQVLAAALLERLGIASSVVVDGERALEQLQARRWDVVLMDCQMPVMDGYEATRRWREMERAQGLPRTPVIALTANAMEGDRDRCIAAGMDDYLSKPIDRAALAARLATWLPG
ncbi:MAG: response regulator [Burkholderiales bacterium]|nr:MAG: response regulator [Burkholderiales bacterium]